MIPGIVWQNSGGIRAMSEQSYARAVRLIYLARYRVEKPKAALAQAHRLAARVVRAVPGDDDATVQEAARRLTAMGNWRTRRHRGLGTGPYLVPPEPTPEQREVLDRLGTVEYDLRIAVLRHLLDGAEPDDLGAGLSPDHQQGAAERIRLATAKVCEDRDIDDVRALLTGPGLDPMTVTVPAEQAFASPRRGSSIAIPLSLLLPRNRRASSRPPCSGRRRPNART
jgi:hypothetical protein